MPSPRKTALLKGCLRTPPSDRVVLMEDTVELQSRPNPCGKGAAQPV
jgi:Flp pilus assembly CpaF family ATPase